MTKIKKKKTIKVNDSASSIIPCTMCNPKKYLKFSFAFITKESSSPKTQDLAKLWERMRWLSRKPYMNLFYTYQSDKHLWFELLPIEKLRKDVPPSFRTLFPSETNEKYAVLRVYPAGTPNGAANPRIIGMLKHTVFYVFFLDWDGNFYDHGR